MDDNTNLQDEFDRCAAYLRTVVTQLNSEDLLYFYGRYKQVTEGPCQVQKPWFFDVQAKQKWSAWKSLNNMSTTDAMAEYVQHMNYLKPGWDTGKQVSSSWVAVSCLNHGIDEPEPNNDIMDSSKTGNMERIVEILKSSPEQVNTVDEQSLTPLHWSCDRGHVQVVKLLHEHGAKLNAKDEDGQTPLHYAVSCEHMDIAQFLVLAGADPDIADNDGETVRDLINNSHLCITLAS